MSASTENSTGAAMHRKTEQNGKKSSSLLYADTIQLLESTQNHSNIYARGGQNVLYDGTQMILEST